MKSEGKSGLFFIFIVIPVLASVLFSSLAVTSPMLNIEKPINLSKDWAYSVPATGAEGKVDLPAVISHVPANAEVRLRHSLDGILPDHPALFITTEQQQAEVLIDGVPVYEYQPENDAGSTPVNLHFVELPGNLENREIEMVLSSRYGLFSCKVNSIYTGSKSSLVLSLAKQDIFPLGIALLSLFLGMILIIIFVHMKVPHARSAIILYLGLFFFIAGIRMGSERRLLLLFIDNPVFIQNVSLASLYCLPVPLLLFVKRAFKLINGKMVIALSWAFCCFITASTVLKIINIADYIQLLPVFHALAIMGAVHTCVEVYRAVSGSRRRRHFFYSCLILGILMLSDIVLTYTSPLSGLRSIGFFHIAVLFSAVVLSARFGEHFVRLRDIDERNKYLLSIAYTDALTSLKNRTLFDETIKALNSRLDQEESVHLIILDINDLKFINDTLGHAEGDRLLIEGARILQDTLGQIGDVYRIGGDEFAMIILNHDESVINSHISDLFNSIDKYNQKSESLKISIAYGMDCYQRGIDKNLHSVFVRADKAMYNCKENQKHIEVVG